MKSCFLGGRLGVETTNPLGDVNLVDGPCIDNCFGNLVQLFKLTKILPLGKSFAAFTLEASRSLTLSLSGVFEI
jgi:hypothetical protein